MPSGRSRCERVADDLSGFVDQRLSQRSWDRVGYHLAGCVACRREVADLRRIRNSLRRELRAANVARGLAAKLEGIAGDTRDQPLYMAAGTAGGLPTKRSGRRRRLYQGSVVVGLVLTSVVLLSLLLAPAPPQLSNPVAKAREEYSLSMTAVSVNEAMGAALLARSRSGNQPAVAAHPSRGNIVGAPEPITAAAASDALQQARQWNLDYSGTKRVWISNGNGTYYIEDVQIEMDSGRGFSLTVQGNSGNNLSWFVPSSKCCNITAPQAWSYYKYHGIQQIAGRWAKVVEARDADGKTVAKWWLDTANGLLLWTERYGADGKPSIVSGFVELKLDHATLDTAQTKTVMLEPVPSGDDWPEWCRSGARCPTELAGLPLVARAASTDDGPHGMRLVYSDGFRSLSVCWTAGMLKDGQTSVTDNSVGQPSVAVWQTGDGVISVASNAGAELLQQAVKQLPAPEPYDTDLLDQLGRGLARLTGIH